MGVDLKRHQPRKLGKVLCKGDVEVEKGTSGCWIGKGLKQSKTGGWKASEEAIRAALVRTDSGRGSREGNFDRPKSSNECPRGQFADGSPTGSDRESGPKDNSWGEMGRNWEKWMGCSKSADGEHRRRSGIR